jgi:tetratricopeptide (TPR) repeat protein
MRLVPFAAVSVLCVIAGAAPQVIEHHAAEAKTSAPMPQPEVKSEDHAPAVAPISLADSDGQELILEELSARTAIEGMLSLTELDLRFRNPKPRQIEGRFACTLPARAAISRFAKDVNGQLMEGEVVERLRANQVYEQFLHQMRDPALLEQDQGNRFSARIFPIGANASVHLVLSYTSLLPVEGGVRRYRLPLRGLPMVKQLTFRAFVTALPDEATTTSSKVSGLANAKHSTSDVISLDEHDYTPDHDIELTWHPTTNAPQLHVLTGDSGFYVAAYRPTLSSSAALPARHAWTFYIDTSASSAEGSEHRIHALEALLASLPASDSVELLAFDQEIASLGSGAAAELSRSIGSLLRARLFLGGTDLVALFHHIAKNASGRSIVVASDLVPTLGSVDRHELSDAIKTIPEKTTIHALILGSREDEAMAKALTASRGRVVTIPFSESLNESARDAAAALRRPLGASFDVADSGAQWVYPSHFDDVQNGDEIIVAGFTKTGGDPQPRFNSLAADANDAQRLRAAYAPLLEREAYRAYLDYLAEREANEPSQAVRGALATEQVKVSIEHRVVIPRTTMLVLESEWDYQRFGLDRRALAQILTIDAGGISTIDRRANVNVAVIPPPRPVQSRIERPKAQPSPPPPLPPDVEGGVEGGVVGGVVGGVAGGVVGGSVSDAQTAVVGAGAEAKQENVVLPYFEVDTATATAAAPPPPAVPAPPAPRETREQGTAPVREPTPAPHAYQQREMKRAEVDWTSPWVARDDDMQSLQSRLERDPRDRDLYNKLSDAYSSRAEWTALRRLALQWQPYDPENPQVYEILGVADEHLGNAAEAARADASLIEIAPAKTELLQRAGLLLLRINRAALAETPLRRALELRPDRANGYRHLALMLWRDGRFEEAARVLESATEQQFPGWYGNVHRVISEELGYVYRAWIKKAPERRDEIERRASEHHVDLDRRDALRITLAWETDANDVDLHVVDPSGEECYYSHPSNASGLELYEDITQGLGPEVIRAGSLQKGVYHVGVNYFASGPMGVSRGIVVIMRGDDIDIRPFRLIEGGAKKDMRYIAAINVK